MDPPTSNTYTVVGVQATDETRRMETETVTVNVTNVDEDGTVELSALRPQSDIGLHRQASRTLTGPPPTPSGSGPSSSSKNGAYSPIDTATSADLHAGGRLYRLLPAGHSYLYGPGG